MNLRVFLFNKTGTFGWLLLNTYLTTQKENRNGLAVISPIGEEMTARPFRCFDYQLAFLP